MILPAVANQLIVLIYNMADTFFVGQTNNPYMVAGTSLILPVFNISLCLAGLAGIGGGSMISRLLGQ
ncbi:MAG: MATE family efflux transporter, partial [Oscillospiraceae bacterium]